MSEFRAPVTVWLRPSTYRTLARLAQQRSTTIGELLANLADNATDPNRHERTGKRRWKRTTPQQATDLLALVGTGLGIRPAAEQVGITYATAYRIVTEHRKGAA